MPKVPSQVSHSPELLFMGVQSVIINHPDVCPSPGGATRVVLVTSPVTTGHLHASMLLTVVSFILGSRLPLHHIAVLPVPCRRQPLRLHLTWLFQLTGYFVPFTSPQPIFCSKFLGCLLLTQPVALPHIKPSHPKPPLSPDASKRARLGYASPAEPSGGLTYAARRGSHQPSTIFIHPTVEWDSPHQRPPPPARSCPWGDIPAAFPEMMYERCGSCRAISQH